MRLVNTENLQIQEFRDDNIKKYVILSHTWGEEEVTFQDMKRTRVADKKDKEKVTFQDTQGHKKVKNCCALAKHNGFKYVWIDTCCIDKTSSAELSEAINSMYRWYQEADECYAYLGDVTSESEFSKSRWFTRG
ncbi:hypothetical protein RRF57_012850 [Xylaria bambusicola]|uniref:Heterokaryon incompatibility domain-containing protein n=1 Tax=Xylaria bambusicola TaxID=326684 RepID=A0AAN7UXA7_9PEZI